MKVGRCFMTRGMPSRPSESTGFLAPETSGYILSPRVTFRDIGYATPTAQFRSTFAYIQTLTEDGER